jgi:hemin uptake protein HemP
MRDSKVISNDALNPTIFRTKAAAAALHPERIARVTSESLLLGHRELVIAHAGQEYRLHLTRNDKLILTK